MSVLMHLTRHGISGNHEAEHSGFNNIVNTAALSSKRTTQEQNFSFREKLQTDCHGNTPLHHTVGVYGHLKMSKVSTDVTKTVEFLLRYDADIHAQNNDGLTPLHVARGKQAIKACLQHADDRSFTIFTDIRGRNFWHLLFLTRTQNEVELGTSIRPMIAISDAKYSVDDLNRTPLHYVCMNRNPWINVCNWLAKEFIEKFSDDHVNKQDKFGRNALHYDAIEGNNELKDMLKTKKFDDTVEDNYHKTSSEYSNIQNNYNMQVSLLRLANSSTFIARHRSDISACVQNCFADSSYAVKECKTKLHETVKDLSGFSDAASYVLNIWNGCVYDYIDATHRKPVAPAQCDDQRLCKEEDFVTNNDESPTEPKTMFAAIQSHVNNAMKELAKAITEHDRHRFACDVIPVGSAHEGTKIGCCDEFDYNFVLTNLSSICEVCYSPESPPGFVLLKALTPVQDDEKLKDLFDENGILIIRIVKFKFETLAKQI